MTFLARFHMSWHCFQPFLLVPAVRAPSSLTREHQLIRFQWPVFLPAPLQLASAVQLCLGLRFVFAFGDVFYSKKGRVIDQDQVSQADSTA